MKLHSKVLICLKKVTYCVCIIQRHYTFKLRGLTGWLTDWATNLSNAWVGTLDIPGREVQPATGVGGDGRTVLLHGASAFATTPATLELPLCTQTHATAVPLGTAFVEVHCGITQKKIGRHFTSQYWSSWDYWKTWWLLLIVVKANDQNLITQIN